MSFHFFNQLTWLIPASGGASVVARYIQLRMRQAHRVIFPDPCETLLQLHEAHGYNAHSLVGIAPETRLWSCPETEGAIGFNDFGKVWLVPGEPLANSENQPALAKSFLRAAKAQSRTVGFIPATERFARHSRQLGLRAVKIGSAPYFDLATWAPRGDRGKKARAGINQARRAGIQVKKVSNLDENLIRETDRLCKSWLTTRRSPTKFGWLFAIDLFKHSDRKKYFTARDATGRLVGFLAASPIPARQGWYLEDVLRLPQAPNGTTDLLVVEVLKSLKDDGAKLATLGTAPMALEGNIDSLVWYCPKLSKVTRGLATMFTVFYNFNGVRRFKAKFAPSWWESEYLLVSDNLTGPPRIILAFVQAIVPTGATDLLIQHFRHMRRRIKFKKDMAHIRRSDVARSKSSAQAGPGINQGGGS
jgi:phosphatidylglycerol lysyltransferase